MNQAQRKFLIDKIEKETKIKCEFLEKTIPEAPSLSNYLLNAVMSNTFELQPQENIRESIRKKALNAKHDDWMDKNSWHSSGNGKTISLNVYDVFVIPENYKQLRDEYLKTYNSVHQEIIDIKTQCNSLVVRIQLASDKTLQSMINEVDDMGDIKLMETVLRTGIGSGSSNKLLDQ